MMRHDHFMMAGWSGADAVFFSLAPYRQWAVILLSGLTLAAISMIGLWRVTTTQPSNPFSTYADILPGQPKEMPAARGFDCQKKTNYHSSDYATCTLIPKSGTFSQIQVLTSDDKIVQSTFFIPDNTLKFGDLMLTLSPDKLQIHPYELFFFWQSLFISVKTSKRLRAVALRPVSVVTFTDVTYVATTTTITAQP